MKNSGTFAVILVSFFLMSCQMSGSPSELKFQAKVGDSKVGTSGPIGVADRAKSLAAFSQTVYPIVRANSCVNCHSSQTLKQAPIFADYNVESAYDAITLSRKVDLVTPGSSRIVLKVKDTSHNCWSGDCLADSNVLLDAVKEWALLAPSGSGTGGEVSTEAVSIPSDSTAIPSQTEYGTLLLQAEQEQYRSEVVSGRFSDQSDSSALEGKYLLLTPPEANPITPSARSLVIDANRFNSCKPFEDADLLPATRAIRIMQQKVHISSGENNGAGKIINNGYRPFVATLSMNVIRPDKRLDYARMIYNANYSNTLNVLFRTGAPAAVNNKAVGTKLPETFQGDIFVKASEARILPHFAEWSLVFNPDGSYKTGGTFIKDDGTSEDLYELFKEGAYSPLEPVLRRNLIINSGIKKDTLYKLYKDSIKEIFYESPTVRRNLPNYPYSKFIGSDFITYFYPEVNVELRCPAGQVCDANVDLLKYHVTSQTGAPLTQANALDCYTLNDAQTSLVRAGAGSCNGTNPRFFHYIDLFIRPMIDEATLFGTQTMKAYVSGSPNAFTELETFTEDKSKELVFHRNQTPEEIDPDVFFNGGAGLVSDEDNQRNFSSTLYAALKTTRCIDCHGNPAQMIPQFASQNISTSLAVLKTGGFINFDAPSTSFRPNGMVHNCNTNSTDPRYSCADASETALRLKLSDAITAWKQANLQSAQDSGVKPYRALTRDERLPGRAKYTFKVTESGLYNVWLKTKNITGNSNINFRILSPSGTPVNFSTGASTSLGADSCYRYTPNTTIDLWEWSTPGRSAELSSLDQRGYRLLNDQKQPLPLANNRIYFNLLEGGLYTLDVIGLTQGMRLDAVGINKVANFNPDARLEFQPDRRVVDEKNISDYKRKVLKFDLSSQLGLTSGRKAFFEIEVKKEFNGQNYIFRNPRFSTTPRTPTPFNLAVKGIKVLINGKWNYPDATYNNLDVVTGDNQVLTYAPLIALTTGPSDLISFQFSSLSVSSASLSQLYPKGNPPAIVEDRRCADLDYFIKNVKPILFEANVTLIDDIKDYNRNFPGGPRSMQNKPDALRCVSCHTQTHPYFKMSTFLNNEEFCREALSRVDFQNFYQSLVIRGINGTGNHPKFVFMEKFVNGPDDNFKVHDGGQDYMLNRYINNAANPSSRIASTILPGPMITWTKEAMGITKTNYADLTAQERAKIVKAGLFRVVNPTRVNMDVVNYPWYSADKHYSLLYADRNNRTELDNILSAFDVIDPGSIGKLEPNRDRGPYIFTLADNDANGVPLSLDFRTDGAVPLKGGTKVYTTNGRAGFDPATLDYLSNTPENDPEAQMWSEYEILRDYYREKVINWIRRENAARPK